MNSRQKIFQPIKEYREKNLELQYSVEYKWLEWIRHKTFQPKKKMEEENLEY